MITGGVDVDIETGLPRAAVASKQNHAEVIMAMGSRAESQAQETLAALYSPEGQVLVKEGIAYLERRCEAFMQQDPGCQAVISLFKSLGFKANVAHNKANRTIEKILGFKAAP